MPLRVLLPALFSLFAMVEGVEAGPLPSFTTLLTSVREQTELAVETRAPVQLSAIERLLPPGSQVIEYHPQMRLVRLRKPASPVLMKKIRSLQGVLSVRINTHYTHQNADPPCEPRTDPEDLIAKLKTLSRELAQDESCYRVPSCNALLKHDAYWAQNRVDRHEMLSLLKQWDLDSKAPPVKVAILDTGLDSKNLFAQKLADDTVPTIYAQGFPEAGDPQRDEDGHGTPIFSLFKGKDIGLAPDAAMTVMRVTPKGKSGIATRAAIDTAVRNACDAGNSIIVLSWGRVSEQEAKESYFTPNLHAELRAKGCTVVRAGGNESKRDVARAQPIPGDPDLTVASIDRSGRYSTFSSTGVVGAPGTNVFVYPSRDPATPPSTALNECDGTRGALINGTSFAGPIAGAILTQVEKVLSKHPAYLTLPGAQRIEIRSQILKASEFGGTVNGVRAILMARNWSPDRELTLDSVRTLLTQPDAHPVCSQNPPLCSSIPCEQRMSCLDTAGLHLKVCSTSLRPNQVLQFMNDVSSSGSSDLSIQWMRTFQDFSPISEPHKREFFKRLWATQIPTTHRPAFLTPSGMTEGSGRLLGPLMDPSTTLRIGPSVIRSLKGQPNAKAQALEVFNAVIMGRGLRDSVIKSQLEAWVTRDKVEEFVDLFRALNEIDEGLFEQAIRSWRKPGYRYVIWPGIPFGKIPLPEETLGLMVWGLHHLGDDPAFKSKRPFIQTEIEALLKDFNSRNVAISDSFYSIIEPSIAHKSAEWLDQARTRIQRDQIELLTPLEVRDLLNKSEKLGKQQDRAIAQILSRISKSQGWRASDIPIAKHAITEIMRSSSTPQALEAYREGIRSGENPQLTFVAFSIAKEFQELRDGNLELDPNTLKQAFPQIDQVLDPGILSLTTKRVGHHALQHPEDMSFGHEYDAALIRSLSKLPENPSVDRVVDASRLKEAILYRRISEAEELAPPTPPTSPAIPNQTLADLLTARIVRSMVMAAVEIKKLERDRNARPGANPQEEIAQLVLSMPSRRQWLKAQATLSLLSSVIPSTESSANSERWAETRKAIREFQREAATRGLRIEDPWLLNMLQPTTAN